MIRISRLCQSSVMAGLMLWCVEARAQAPTAQWDFDSGNLNATVGGMALTFAEGPGGLTDQGTQFGTTTALGIPNIGGSPASVMRFAGHTNNSGYYMQAPLSPNGGGSLVNDWTIVMDVLYPSNSLNTLRPLVDGDGSGISAEPEFVVSAANGLGVGGGASFGTLQPNAWYRLGIVVSATNMYFYVNGIQVGSTAGSLDGRFALSPGGFVLLLGTPGANAGAGYVNSIQVRDTALSRGQMMALGAASATGIPQTLPPVPSYVEKWTPGGAVASRSTPLGVVFNRGDSTITGITLKLDGVALDNPVINQSGSTISVSKTGNPPLALNSTHTLEVSFTDSQAGAKSFSTQFKAVLLFEDFEGLALIDAVEEPNGMKNAWTPAPPAGWVTNHSGMPGYGDPANDGRTEWAGWTFALKDFWIASDNQTRDLFTKGQGTLAIADTDEWDDANHPSVDDQGNPVYFNSFLSTPAINIAGLPAGTLYVKFDSAWRPEGNMTATLTASYNGAAPANILRWESQEGPFFHPDSQNESVFLQLTNTPAGATNMVLTFGLTLGDNNWFWAFDNLEINAGVIAPTINTQPLGQLVSPGGDVLFNVRATGTDPLAYQWLFNGAPIASATNNSHLLVNAAPATAGDYRVVVSNAAGSVTSSVAKVTLFSGPITQGLVAHLKFDGTYTDASGRGNNATAVNSPTFEAGRVGQAVHINSSTTLEPNNYVTLGYPNDLKLGSGTTASNVSFSFWTKVLANSGDKPFISNKNWVSGNNPGFALASRTTGISWNFKDDQSGRRDSGIVGPQLADRTNWHHVTATFDRAGLGKIYVDGQLANSTSIAPDAGKPIGNMDTDDAGLVFNIGQDGGGNYTDNGSSGLDALIDDMGIWKRVLTPQEVLALYTAGLENKDLSTAVVAAGTVAPSITQEPSPSTIEEGLVANFSVTATGTAPFTYQWYKNGGIVSGASSASLAINRVQMSDAGTYTVVIANSAGSVTSAPVALTVLAAPPVEITGQWDFNNGDLRATIGSALTNFDETVASDTQFGDTASFGIAGIGGSPAKVLFFSPSVAPWGGYIMPHGAAPNGGGIYVNRYTVIWDLYYPESSNGKWRSLFQTAINNNNDGDFFINTGNGIGISASYQGIVPAEAWTRIVAVFDLPYRTLKKYINGVLVNTQTLGEGTDGRWSLDPTALLFGDEDGDANPGYANSIQFRNGLMSDAEVLALGGVTTDGIPGMPPRISSIVREGNSLRINWNGAPGLRLQQSPNLGAGPWTDVAGSAGASTITVPVTGSAGFFRLAQ